MENLTREELIAQLEQEAKKIHSSTRVDIPIFSPLHNFLRAKYPTYYKWSIVPKSRIVHLMAVLGFLISIFVILILNIT